jgi:hypothetical protein
MNEEEAIGSCICVPDVEWLRFTHVSTDIAVAVFKVVFSECSEGVNDLMFDDG